MRADLDNSKNDAFWLVESRDAHRLVLTDLITARSVVVGGWEEPPNACNWFIYGPQHLSVELWMLSKGAVIARAAFMGLLIYYDWENYEPERIN